MAKYEFREKELQTGKTRMVFGCEMTDYDTPITPLENLLLSLKGEPVWLPSTFDIGYLYPLCVPDNPAKGNVSDAKLPPEQLGGKDMFGVEWEYVPEVGGSTTRPGHALFSDANDWYDKVVFPTKEVIDSWDWESAKENAKVVMREKDFWEVVICTGFFERLISFMDFEDASVAMIDEDQQDAVKDLFDKLADLYIMLIEKYLDVFGDKIDGVCLHDDWGHQQGILLSIDTIREMVVPYMQKVTDFIHSKGLVTECHSCGRVDLLVPLYIEAGFQMLECQYILDFDTLVPKYGDRLMMHVTPDNVPAPDAPEEEHIQSARAFVDRMIAYGNPFLMDNYYAPYPLTKTFDDEVYRYSRKRLSE